MGRWGMLLFQGDYDLDIAGDLSEDCGVELDMFDYTEGPGSRGIGMEATRAKLNDGTLARVFDQYKVRTARDMFWCKEHYMVILAALAMRVGATIRDEDLLTLENVYHRSGIPKPSQAQFKQALTKYRNDGTPLTFDSPGLIETMMNSDLDDVGRM